MASSRWAETTCVGRSSSVMALVDSVLCSASTPPARPRGGSEPAPPRPVRPWSRCGCGSPIFSLRLEDVRRNARDDLRDRAERQRGAIHRASRLRAPDGRGHRAGVPRESADPEGLSRRNLSQTRHENPTRKSLRPPRREGPGWLWRRSISGLLPLRFRARTSYQPSERGVPQLPATSSSMANLI